MIAQFNESLTQEKKKIIQMGLMKNPKAHALTMHDGKESPNQKSKQKRKELLHLESKKEGYSKTFKDSSGSKDSSNSKGKKKKGKQCTYWNNSNHE
jgi:hypothetical protein